MPIWGDVCLATGADAHESPQSLRGNVCIRSVCYDSLIHMCCDTPETEFCFAATNKDRQNGTFIPRQ